MGYRELEREEVESSNGEAISYTKCFEEYCPIFISYGMSYDDFWYGDLYKTRYYAKAHKIRLKERDMELWEQGMYIYEAILQCTPILHPFSKAKKPLPYTEKPHLMQIVEEEKNSEQAIENERLKAQIWLNTWTRSMQMKFKNKVGD